MKRKTILSSALNKGFLFAAFVTLLSLGSAGAAFGQAPSCYPVPTPGCLYFPSSSFPLQTTTRQTTYTDATGHNRTIEFAIRSPVGLPAPLPIVIWSHGGNDGKSNPLNVGVEWSETLASGGYIVVSIAHEPRTIRQRNRLCDHLGFTTEACVFFKYLHWDRPFDISAVIDELARVNVRPNGEFFHKLDMDRIAVAGHSSGSGGVMSVAGAIRDFDTGAPFAPADARPKVFMAFSPQQPGTEGFFDTAFQNPHHSWEFINRPVLIATGDGDNLCLSDYPGTSYTPGDCKGQVPYGRRIPFERMLPTGNKYRLYLRDADIFHGMFDLNVSKCAPKGVNPAKCLETARSLSSVAFAFLDSHLKGVPFATAWLNSNNIEFATGGVAEYSRK